MPQCYINFFCEISTNVPVAGLIQVKVKQSITILKNFCKQKIDVRNGKHKTELDLLRSQMPVMWRLLNSICVFNDSNFLPNDISKIVLKLIQIQKETFQVQRYKEDYIQYNEPGVFFEHPIYFYPSHPLVTYPNIHPIMLMKNFVQSNFQPILIFRGGSS